MHAELIQLYEKAKGKKFPFLMESVEYSAFPLQTEKALSLYRMRYENNHAAYSEQRKKDFNDLIDSLADFHQPSLKTHIFTQNEELLVLLTDLDSTILIGTFP